MPTPQFSFVWQTAMHPPIQVGTRTLTPRSRVVGLRWAQGGWLWQFPVAVEVTEDGTAGGAVQRLPIVDGTRWVVLAMALGTLWLVWRARRRPLHE